ncbi:hypothetical protein [Actinomadura flavalba]|uniref:hypothetical protein n=1 Tax=Actinomadura flavalba TaxID=1120938 RepID=UPI00039DE4E6|nr:hypothetical protein [Actinomadura flavalba]
MDMLPRVVPPRLAPDDGLRDWGADEAAPPQMPVRRMWSQGRAAIRGTAPARRLAATVAGAAADGGYAFAGWEFSAKRDGLTEARTEVRWDDPRAGRVHAAVMVRGLPDGRDDEMTCEWAVVADAEHGWRWDMQSPCTRLRLVGEEFADPAGFEVSDDVLYWSLHLWDDEDVDDLVGRLGDPERNIALIVVDIGSDDPEAASHGIFPGVCTLALVEEESRQVLNRLLPQRPVPSCGVRYLPAPVLPGTSDQRFGNGNARRRATYQRLVDDALAARAAAEPVGLAAEAVTLLPAPREDAGGLRRRVWRLEQELAEARRERAEAERTRQRAEIRADAALARAERLAADLAARPEPEPEVDADARRDALERRLAEVVADRDVYAEALEIAEEERDRAVRQRGLLAVRLARLAPQTEIEEETGTQDVPDDFRTLIAEAARFTTLILDDLDRTVAATLDGYPKATVWRRKTWDALATLDAYAAAKQRAREQDVTAVPHLSDVHAFIRGGGDGALISANVVALGESDTVDADPRYRNARMFRVRPATQPTGIAYFAAHIKIDGPRPPAPRLHFYDDTDGATGRIYVGHIGPHLPTSRTN